MYDGNTANMINILRLDTKWNKDHSKFNLHELIHNSILDQLPRPKDPNKLSRLNASNSFSTLRGERDGIIHSC